MSRRIGMALLAGTLLAAPRASARLFVAREDSGRLVLKNTPANGSDPDAPERLLPGRDAYDAFVSEAAARYDLEPDLIRCVIEVESDYDPRAVSASGARGLMQLMPETARDLGVEDPFDPRENILAGSRYLRSLLDGFGGDLDMGLAGYHAGPSTVLAAGGVPRIKETRAYIRRIRQRLHRQPEPRATPGPEAPIGAPVRLVRDRRGRPLLTNREP